MSLQDLRNPIRLTESEVSSIGTREKVQLEMIGMREGHLKENLIRPIT